MRFYWSVRVRENYPASAQDVRKNDTGKKKIKGRRMAALWRVSFGLRLLRRRRLRLAVGGRHRSTNAGKQLFCSIGVLPGGIQFEILVKGLCGTLGRNHLVALGGGLGQQVDPLPVVSGGFRGIGLNCLVESGNGLIRLTAVGEYSPFIEIVGGGIGRLGLGGRGVLLHRLIGLARFRVSVSEIVVVGADGALNRYGFLIRLDGLRILLGSALRINLADAYAKSG